MTTQTDKKRCGPFEGRGGKKKFLLIPVFMVAFIALKSVAVMLLWNYLIPDLFHGPEVTFVQAIALVVLAKILFGFGGGGGWGRGRFGRGRFGGGFGRGGFGGGAGPWADLSKEDRDKLRTELREKLGDEQ